MFCKVCNTRLSASEQTCPNCGGDAGPEPALSSRGGGPRPLSSPGLDTGSDSGEEDDLEVELELNEISGEIPPPPKPKPAPKRAAARNQTPPPKPSGAAPLFAPDPAGLRALLVEQPEALEQGLAMYRDEKGTPVGEGYTTAVGDIDLLASDVKGNLVVVMISEKDQGEELVAEVLQRVGWVRKHLGEGKKTVRGIVLCEEPPESLSYAAAAVADTILFKTYRVALTFEDLDV
jgi:hypothetical protein